MGEEGQDAGQLEGGQGQESTQQEGVEALGATEPGAEGVAGGEGWPGVEGGQVVEETTTTTETTQEPTTPVEEQPAEQPTETQQPAEEQQADVPAESPGWQDTRDAADAQPDTRNEQGGPLGIHAEVDHETGKQGPPSDPPQPHGSEGIQTRAEAEQEASAQHAAEHGQGRDDPPGETAPGGRSGDN